MMLFLNRLCNEVICHLPPEAPRPQGQALVLSVFFTPARCTGQPRDAPTALPPWKDQLKPPQRGQLAPPACGMLVSKASDWTRGRTGVEAWERRQNPAAPLSPLTDHRTASSPSCDKVTVRTR